MPVPFTILIRHLRGLIFGGKVQNLGRRQQRKIVVCAVFFQSRVTRCCIFKIVYYIFNRIGAFKSLALNFNNREQVFLLYVL